MSFVGDWFRTAIARAAAGEFGHRVTLESISNEAVWVQLSWDTINAAYPFQVSPSQIFRELGFRLPPLAEVTDWAPEAFVTIEHSAEPLDDLVTLVENYVTRVLGAPIEQASFKISESS